MKNFFILGSLLAGGAGIYAYNLKKTGDRLETGRPQVKVHRVGFKNATLKATITLINKGTVPLHIDDLKINLEVKNSAGVYVSILQNVVSPATISVRPGQEETFDLMLEALPNLQLIKLIGSTRFTEFRNKGLRIKTTTSARINKLFPFSSEDTIALKLTV